MAGGAGSRGAALLAMTLPADADARDPDVGRAPAVRDGSVTDRALRVGARVLAQGNGRVPAMIEARSRIPAAAHLAGGDGALLEAVALGAARVVGVAGLVRHVERVTALAIARERDRSLVRAALLPARRVGLRAVAIAA